MSPLQFHIRRLRPSRKWWLKVVAVLKSLKKQWKNTPPRWKKGDPCGRKWVGIYCNNSRVTDIILSGMNLKGPLPEDIVSLSELRTLDLSNNRDLTGTLPENIGNLTNLVHLALVGCNLSGPIPESIGSLRKLTHLFLNSNNFTGHIPPSIGDLSNLIWLDLSENQLDGGIPVSNGTSSGLDRLLKAQHFHLGKNHFYGEISAKLFSSGMALLHAIFDNNQLSGNIPESIALVHTLEVIRLDANVLNGSVPETLNNLTKVSELYLANNQLTGPIPNLTGMDQLTFVDLSNNTFTASGIPHWLTTLTSLTTIMMENIGLEGEIPTSLFSLPDLQTVVLSHNRLNGTVDIGTVLSNQLKLVDLRYNSIDEFNPGVQNMTFMLDGNPFCNKLEAAGICKNPSPSIFPYLNFQPVQNCASLSCFSPDSGSQCKCKYFGHLAFRSFSFSHLSNLSYYSFLDDSLKNSFSSRQVPVNAVCLLGSSIDANGYLILDIAILPFGKVCFNRTAISLLGNILNNHIFNSPYGPYFFHDITYRFPGDYWFYIPLRESFRSYIGFIFCVIYFFRVSTASNPLSTGAILGLSVAGSVLVLLLIFAGLYAHRQRRKADKATKLNNPFASWNQENSGKIPQLKGVKWYSFEDVKKFTHNFSEGSEIGSGGYGKVYKGRLPTGELVAIKRAKRESMQGALEFKTEIEILSRVHHKNLVNLNGFCYDKGEQMLIYEYIPNGTVREILSGKSGIHLDWRKRLKVALDSARGLVYLHELADPPIIHRDIKSSNILLDVQLNAKVADFGLSEVFTHGIDHVTTQVKGTLGYLDPEYYNTQQLTEKSDVYSYGVVILELITGKPPLLSKSYIVREVREAINSNVDPESIADPAMKKQGTPLVGLKEFVSLGLRCLQDSGADRPTMNEVAKEIERIIQEVGMNPNNMDFSGASYGGSSEGSHPSSNDGLLSSRGSFPLLR